MRLKCLGVWVEEWWWKVMYLSCKIVLDYVETLCWHILRSLRLKGGQINSIDKDE